MYIFGWSDKLFKVKCFEDVEGKVLVLFLGKGWFKGMMGLFFVEMWEGI